jgi:putative ubiquitin-RnfH superfamily antitoxin RatB of RatAB toxin-antitoxin module
MTTRMMAAFLAVAALAMAQKPKSKSENDALIAIQGEKDPAAKITKIDEFVKKYADTDYKAAVYTQAAQSADQLHDGAKVIIYSELALEADPKALQPRLMAASELARSTRENDLDKEEKLTKAEKYAKEALDLAPAAVKPNPQIPDDQWEEIKKEFSGDAHQALGMISTVRKKYDVAIKEFTQAVTIPATPDPATFIRLAAAYNDSGNPDGAIATLAKMPADPRLKPFVDKEQKRAETLKAAKK